IGPDSPVHPDFGAGLWEGAPIGIPYAVVGAGQPLVDVSFRWPDESDPGPYPVPPDAPVEGAPPGGVAPGGDRHVLVLDSSTCRLYELFAAVRQPDGSWEAAAGAELELGRSDLRPDGRPAADAPGLPSLPRRARC